MRQILDPVKIEAHASSKIEAFHSTVVAEVKQAVSENKVVVIGMTGNIFVGKARKLLASNGVEHKYLAYGSYFGGWKQRLAIKLWSGWPTFPQVFVEGRLVGGYTDLEHLIREGKLTSLN